MYDREQAARQESNARPAPVRLYRAWEIGIAMQICPRGSRIAAAQSPRPLRNGCRWVAVLDEPALLKEGEAQAAAIAQYLARCKNQLAEE